MGDEKHPGFHRLITPHHVINLVGSNKFTLHRLYQRLESMGMDPATAKVIPPPWPPGFRTDRPNTVGGPDLGDLPAESPPEEEAPHVTETKEMEDGINDPEGMQKLYGNLETHLERYERRLQVYRALMAPNAAAARNRLISEAIKMGEHVVCERYSLFIYCRLTACQQMYGKQKMCDTFVLSNEDEIGSFDLFLFTHRTCTAVCVS